MASVAVPIILLTSIEKSIIITAMNMIPPLAPKVPVTIPMTTLRIGAKT